MFFPKSVLLVAAGFATNAMLCAAQDPNPEFFTNCTKRKQWALTFDDGPTPYTPDLLKILADNKIPATFFISGYQIRDDPSRAKFTYDAFKAGHQIASHTFSHLDLNDNKTDIDSEMVNNQKIIASVIDKSPAHMRPPYGNCNEVCAAYMKQNKYSVIQWNTDSNDWRRQQDLNMTQLDLELLSGVNKTSVISLQHDLYNFSIARVANAAKIIRANGFKLVTVAECIRRPAYRRQKKNGVTTIPPVPLPPISDCEWGGHCLGDKCNTCEDCDGNLVCSKGLCSVADDDQTQVTNTEIRVKEWRSFKASGCRGSGCQSNAQRPL